ncbi:hypothetical protein SDRG_07644 [Saprolegnia diclina VS20]|uniref:Uncharacterized protein n=1 Tax=Saprolegnia diclina (strain VS20) TaxID=1156394 RepID=T0QM08_SAPDV|nr:hypothetical protein SDRG_07644 [Saprolegnia diclina VS20]EQC34840.1 hypothetical protein SDRG_07644 [Saprolegnia diclina VS20]|eukprot:XP_008611712.1 hypothetical protein SDRG_07644 [Saprolegnia diclina VS20]
METPPTCTQVTTGFQASRKPPATVDSIKQAFEDISFDRMRRHLTASKKPFVVISGVSVEVFNAYFEDDEAAPVALRFVDLVNGSIIITDFPSEAHEYFIGNFESEFLHASGNHKEVRKSGSFTASRGQGIMKKAADATFGPMHDTLNRGPRPTLDEGPPRVLRDVSDWVTLAVEVGYAQAWTGLLVAGNWWSNYVGVKYVVLARIDEEATTLEYRLYEIVLVGDLAVPSQQGTLTVEDDAAAGDHTLRFDTRVVLAIPPGLDLPPQMNDFCNVNLLDLLQETRRSMING